jgi:ATP-binding cassette subfamily C (CFTR/MRP) protein 1
VFDFLRAEEEIKSSFDQENAIERGNIVFDNASFKWDKRNGDVMKPSAEKPRVNQNSSALEKSENTKVNSALEKIEYPEVNSALEKIENPEVNSKIENPEVKTDDGFSLADVSINIPTGCKVGIVGAVGSGKSSLFSALIGEMRSTSGIYGFNGKLSYCVQQPWILTDTVRGNIVFNNTEDEKRLEHVIKLCGLEKDLRELPSGDQTEIGEKGINLSGGQKARIALARALYQDTDIYLLDDPLSALDAHVGRTVFDNVVMKALNGKTVLLVTHQLHMIHELDYIVVMGHGKVVEQGKYDDLIEQKGLLFELMKSYSIDKKKALVDESANADPKKELISEEGIISKEDQEQGAVKAKVFWSYIEACGGWSFLLFIIFAALLNSGTQVMTNIWLTWWSEGKEDRFGLKLTRFDPNTTNFYLTWYGALAILQFVLACIFNLI